MSRRSPETLADYLVVAITPALIMLLVGSLMFFLIEVFYQGQYQTRLLFVMAMFVMAIVCVARIAMTEGAGYASLFGLPLAGVVGLALMRFVEFQGPLAAISPFVNFGLMALVWWSAHKLTWDCTLFDETRDMSGQGLLQQVSQAVTPLVEGASDPATPPLSWWQRWLEADRQPHAPGVWVIYFSLAALPLYGLGGWFVPGDDLATRRRCFWLLVVYVASALALLLSTSFLGLRKYLRQRKLEMPLEMAAAWVGAGVVLIAGTLVVAALLPRPSPEYSVAHLIDVKSVERAASKFGFGPDGVKPQPDQSAREQPMGETEENEEQSGEGKGKGKSQKQGESGEQGKGSAEQGKGGGDSSKSGQGDSKQSESAQSGDKQAGEKPGGQNKSPQDKNKSDGRSAETSEQDSPPSDQQPESQEPTSSSPPASTFSLSQIFGWLGWLVKGLLYLVVAIVAAYFAWKNWPAVRAAWQKLLAELRELWGNWFGGKTSKIEPEAAPAPPPPKPLAEFADPFASGAAARWTPAELVRYTFAALEAWGREHGCPRPAGQTPHEFAAALGQVDGKMAPEARALAEIYAQLAYAPAASVRGSLDPLRGLWQRMQGTH